MKNMCSRLDAEIGLAVVLCLFVCHIASLLGIQIQALAACTAAVMCVQESTKASWGAGINRILGVLCGGAVGVAIVWIDNSLQMPLLFYILCGCGVIGNLMLCRSLKMPPVQGRVSCMSLLLVVLVLQDSMRIGYALGRLGGTVCGAVLALLVSMAFSGSTVEKESASV